jgi:maleylacetate reductase
MSSSWTHTGYAQRVHFGFDVIDRVAEVVRGVGGRRVMLVTSSGRRSSDAGERVVNALGRMLVSTFDGVRPHVPARAVQAAVAQAGADGVDAVVSLGGGSAADLGKAVCFFAEQHQGMPGTSYTDRPLIAHVAIPTTYSGAELTPSFGMTDEGMRRKTGAGGPTSAPLAALYDPVLTLATPGRISAETGMTALAHGVECACSPERTPEAEVIALASVSRVAAALPEVVAEPADLQARARMLEAAVLAARCLHNAPTGVHHALAQLLGGRTGLAHGLASAILLAPAARWSFEAAPDAARLVGAALGDEHSPAEAIDGLRQRLGLPGRLSDAGVSESDLDAVARMASGLAPTPGSPRPVTEDDVRTILDDAW